MGERWCGRGWEAGYLSGGDSVFDVFFLDFRTKCGQCQNPSGRVAHKRQICVMARKTPERELSAHTAARLPGKDCLRIFYGWPNHKATVKKRKRKKIRLRRARRVNYIPATGRRPGWKQRCGWDGTHGYGLAPKLSPSLPQQDVWMPIAFSSGLVLSVIGLAITVRSFLDRSRVGWGATRVAATGGSSSTPNLALFAPSALPIHLPEKENIILEGKL